MKLPLPAPVLTDAHGLTAEELLDLMTAAVDDSAYLHWDQLRHRTPPRPWTHEQWWFALKLQRRKQARPVSLRAQGDATFSYVLTDTILKCSDEITSRSSGHVGAPTEVLTPHHRNQYIVRSLVEEAITSSQLEGASTSRRLAQEMLDTGRRPQDKSELMIWNNYLAMQRIREVADRPLTPEFIMELHSLLVDGTLDDPEDAGRVETSDHQRVAVWDEGTKIHQPPPAEELPQRLADLCRFANGEDEDELYMSPVVRSIILHFMVGYDHYLVDGNGRTARALFYWSMLHHGFWLAEYVAISRILRNAPSRYSLAYVYSEDDEGDLTYFIHYQLSVFMRALNDLDDYISAKSAEISAVREHLRSGETGLNLRQLSALEALTEDDSSTWAVEAYARRFNVSDQTARNDLNDLTQRKYLTQFKSGRANTWRLSRRGAQQLGLS